MDTDFILPTMTRRDLLRSGAMLGGALLVPSWILPSRTSAFRQAAATVEAVETYRKQVGATPITQVKLTDSLTMLSGPGGNVVALNGPDGKVVVDCFVQPAWPRLKEILDGMGKPPIHTLIDTHWHFDHADNNANLKKAGAAVVAHENTRKRLTETHELLGMRFLPVPAEALPTRTFRDTNRLQVNGEEITLGHIPPSHTDTDIYIRFAKGNVLHMGDVFFSGMYPFFDTSTGGNINGMIAGAALGLKLADASTKIVPGHGPLASKADLTKSHDMLVDVRDRVQKLKKSGRTLEQVIADAPTKDLDATWGKGFMQANNFVTLVYNTL
jgi:glyoxylase-like metal-dependent hydrolase (beta-lactamase superfamily II)